METRQNRNVNGELRKAGTEKKDRFTAENAECAETSFFGSNSTFSPAKQSGMSNGECMNAKEAHDFPFPVFLSSPFKIQIV
jgi:hypothetical protein